MTQVHTVRFSEQSPYGLQPLELLDDADIGGVRRRCLAFINLLARQGALGQRQRPALFRLLIEGYRRFGFYVDDPRTWTLEHDPRGRPGLSARPAGGFASCGHADVACEFHQERLHCTHSGRSADFCHCPGADVRCEVTNGEVWWIVMKKLLAGAGEATARTDAASPTCAAHDMTSHSLRS